MTRNQLSIGQMIKVEVIFQFSQTGPLAFTVPDFFQTTLYGYIKDRIHRLWILRVGVLASSKIEWFPRRTLYVLSVSGWLSKTVWVLICVNWSHTWVAGGGNVGMTLCACVENHMCDLNLTDYCIVLSLQGSQECGPVPGMCEEKMGIKKDCIQTPYT